MKKSEVNEEKRFFNRIFKESGEKYFINDWLIDFLGFKKVKAGQRKKQRILDMGCGVGRHSLQLAKLGYQATGLDISSQGIALGKQKAKEKKLSPRFLCRDIQKTDLPSNFFDKILLIDCLHHFFSGGFDDVLNEAKRLLKPAGQLIIVEPNHFHPFNFLSFSLGRLLGKMVTRNERSLNPYQLKKFLEKDWQLVEFGFFRYFEFISKAVALKSPFPLKQIRKIINKFSLLLPTQFKCDHFVMKLMKR